MAFKKVRKLDEIHKNLEVNFELLLNLRYTNDQKNSYNID